MPGYYLLIWLEMPLLAALAGLAWLVLVFLFVHPAVRASWGEQWGAGVSAVVACLAVALAAVGSVAVFLLLLALYGGEDY